MARAGSTGFQTPPIFSEDDPFGARQDQGDVVFGDARVGQNRQMRCADDLVDLLWAAINVARPGMGAAVPTKVELVILRQP